MKKRPDYSLASLLLSIYIGINIAMAIFFIVEVVRGLNH